jgi:hypothetical protein
MAQLSIFEKQRHRSDKDFTCSIGKNSRVYITFRHKTWERFTSSDFISVYIGKNGAIKFGDPKDTKMLAPCFKLQQGKAGEEETRETTRYLQIEGKKYPAILEQVRRTAGSYDFPEVTADPKITKVVATTTIDKPVNKEVRERFEQMVLKPKLTAVEKKTISDAFSIRREQFKEDLKTLTDGVESQEERIAIINALAGLYGRNNKTVPYDPTDPWDIP